MNLLQNNRRLTRALVPLVILCALVCSGCGKNAASSEPAGGESDLPEVVAVRKAFESAAPSFRNPVGQVLELVNAGKINRDAYKEAQPQLETLVANSLITSDQKRALEALLERLKTELQTRK